MIVIGSARIAENGKATGGQAGDQKQTSTPDYKGEVSMQEFYVSSKGWYVIRPKDKTHAKKIAERMETACNNPNIGYDQDGRYGVIKNGKVEAGFYSSLGLSCKGNAICFDRAGLSEKA